MTNDEVCQILFIILYIMYIMYLQYIQQLTIVKSDWKDFTCNPIYLFIDSAFSPDAVGTTKRFEKCVKKVANN